MKHLTSIIILLALCAVARGQTYYDSRTTNTLTEFLLAPLVPFTVMSWAKFDGPCVVGHYSESIVSCWDKSTSQSSLFLSNILNGAPTTNGIIQFWVYTNNARAVMASNTAQTVLGRWYHVAGVCSSTTIELHVDGKLVNSKTFSGPQFVTSNLYVGARYNSVGLFGSRWGLNGKSEDARVYSRALSAQEILEIYHNPCMHEDDPALVLRTCIVTNDTGTALTGVARNYGTGADGTYSNSPTAAQPHVQTEKPLTMELP